MATNINPKEVIEKELKSGSELSIINLVDALIEHAYQTGTSDIHIEPEEERVRIRLRIDGILNDAFIFPRDIQSEVITRIKVLSGLRTDEHQAAQDGRFKINLKELGDVDIRVSIAPTYYGENAVLRLLVDKAKEFNLETLGFSAEDRKKIINSVKRPYGMILATGPTGSGKSTTLYSLIKILNTKEVQIITIEDPIEFSIEGIDQIQVNPRTGLTFSSGLRAILRQDPDIIMVGEIRDEDTARIAINAALTGHLLLSTLHTNDAATTLPRLLDMKIEPFLIASTVNIAMGQRLVRRVCSNCKVNKTLSIEELQRLSEVIPPDILIKYENIAKKNTFAQGTGCEKCNSTGYKGRVVIAEVLNVDDEIREAVISKANSSQIRDIAIKSGMITMIEDGLKKAMNGTTTIEEILRVIHE